jgi:hypothetical protein
VLITRDVVTDFELMRLIRWLRSAWADAGKSGEWMADAFPGASRWGRHSIRTLPRTDMIAALLFLAVAVMIVLFTLVVVLDALT